MHERGSELGPAVADLVAVPGGADKSRVAEREQVAGGAGRAEPGHAALTAKYLAIAKSIYIVDLGN